ncbi:MAG: DUF2207 domain-containing protein, partial [Gammaproteobacteria bacterium]
ANRVRCRIDEGFYADYRDRLNNRIQVGFEVLKVTRDGRNEPYFTERRSNGVRVYIGDENYFLPTGEYEYAITYRTNRQLGFFDNHDELYWNVTGNGWGFAIQEASANIRIPAGVEQSAMAIEGYTGPFGSKAQDYTARITGNSTAFIEATRTLNSREGLTVVLSWPKGVVLEPTAADRAGYLLSDNRGVLLALGGLLLMTAYLYFVWHRYGRDPEAGAVFPHYEPPPKLSPGACRYIQRMAHDHQCFAAAVLNLAVKGYLTIHEGATEALRAAGLDSQREEVLEQLQQSLDSQSGLSKTLLGPLLELAIDRLEAADDNTFVLEKTDSIVGLPALAPGEKALLAKLFVGEKYMVLISKNHQKISAAISAHDKALKRYYQKVNWASNTGLLFPVVFIAAACFAFVFMSAEVTPLVVMLMVLSVPLLGGFAYLLKAPTVIGRKTMDRIDGFKEYLSVAEADDLKRIEGIAGASPEKTPELFERLLPFAVALDVEQPWAEQFEILFMKISAEKGQSYRPGWYNTHRSVGRFSDFTTGLSSSLSTAISSSSAAPGSSSGGGGGGSSGGGGGGGGGGGW